MPQNGQDINVFEELETIAKSFADSMIPQTGQTVRTFKRKFETKKLGTKVRPFRRRKLTKPPQMGDTGSIEEV